MPLFELLLDHLAFVLTCQLRASMGSLDLDILADRHPLANLSPIESMRRASLKKRQETDISRLWMATDNNIGAAACPQYDASFRLRIIPWNNIHLSLY
jgi:hypothetical protein